MGLAPDGEGHLVQGFKLPSSVGSTVAITNTSQVFTASTFPDGWYLFSTDSDCYIKAGSGTADSTCVLLETGGSNRQFWYLEGGLAVVTVVGTGTLQLQAV